MRLTTTGQTHNIPEPVVGRVAFPEATDRKNAFVLSPQGVPESMEGFMGLLTSKQLNAEELADLKLPTAFSLKETDHLSEGDIVVAHHGLVRTLYRPQSEHNALFVTERCNSNCLMCSQPPKDREDIDHFVAINNALVGLIPQSTASLGITGGEPTLLGTRLTSLLCLLRENLPETHIHLLTNGRLFAWPKFTEQFATAGHPDLTLGIPLYSDAATIHDYIVQAKGAFDQTVVGLHQLARRGINVEIRIVLHRLTIPRLLNLAAYIYRTFPFVVHVALMGLEPIGYTPYHRGKLWIDPHEYRETLSNAVEYLSERGLSVSVYNLQRCILPPSLWKFARQSISDWKNIFLPACDPCSQRAQCAGFFHSAGRFHSDHIQPFGWGEYPSDKPGYRE